MICNTFLQLAQNTWTKISEGRSIGYQLKEETLTDLNMLELKRLHPTTVKTQVFTKPQEGKNGADWEWWFHGINNTWIGFRVQAKIINLNSYGFEHLHYQNWASGVYQCDKLIQNALTTANPKVPLYCFFIETDDNTHLTNWSCGTIPHNRALYGCSLTSAFNVRNLRTTNSKHLNDLTPYLKPWHCLVCCKGFGSGVGDFITNIHEYARVNFELNFETMDKLDIRIPESFITTKPPNYVLALLETKNSELQPPDRELDGILVVKEEYYPNKSSN